MEDFAAHRWNSAGTLITTRLGTATTALGVVDSAPQHEQLRKSTRGWRLWMRTRLALRLGERRQRLSLLVGPQPPAVDAPQVHLLQVRVEAPLGKEQLAPMGVFLQELELGHLR